jgi:hypothetical protein
MTELWKHMSEMHGIRLSESDESEIRMAANSYIEKDRIRLINKVIGLTSENIKLKMAIHETLEENLHLADGEDCTLIKLKKALLP